MRSTRVNVRSIGPILGVAALVLSGCGSQDYSAATDESCDDPVTIGFSHPYGEAAFVKAVKDDLTRTAEERGCIKILMDGTQGGDLESQRAAVESWVAQKTVDVIVVQPVDEGSLNSLREKAQADGSKWIQWGSVSELADGSVGFDFVDGGTKAAEAALAWASEKADPDMVAAVFTTPFPPAKPRAEIPIEKLKEAGIDVVSSQECTDQVCGLQITEDVLRANPNLRIVIGNNDDSALGAAKAFANAGIDPATVFIVGQDGSGESLKAVQAGAHFKATVAISVEGTVKGVLDSALNAVSGDGPTDAQAENILVTTDTQEALAKLLDAYGE